MKKCYFITKIFVLSFTAIIIINFFIGEYIFAVPSVIQQSKIGKHYVSYGFRVQSTEGFFKNSMDENGYNNDAKLLDKKGARVIVLGDSFTEAFQVNRASNFCSKTMEHVNTFKRKWVIYNMGVSGNSVAEYIKYGKAILQRMMPNYVVLQVTSSDFVLDALDESKNCYIVQQNNTYLVNSELGASKKIKEIKDKFVAFSPITGYAYTKFKELAPKVFALGTQPFLSSESNKKNTSGKTLNKMQVNLISWEINQLYKIYGEKLIVLYIPSTPNIDPQGNVNLNDSAFNNQIRKRVQYECSLKQIPFLDATKEFEDTYRSMNQFSFGFSNSKPGQGHINKLGHDILAKKLANFLLSLE